MLRFAQNCEAIAATTKKLQKAAIVAEYLKSRNEDEAAISAVFLSGRAFAAWEETTLQIGGSLLWRAVAELSEKDESALTAVYRKHGDLGAVAEEVLPHRSGQGLKILEVADAFRQVAAARGPAAKVRAGSRLAGASHTARSQIHREDHDWRFADWTEGKPGRGGNRESLRCRPRGGAAGEHAAGATSGRLCDLQSNTTWRMRRCGMFHPLGFMLSSPVESAEEGLTYFAEAAVEDKYDGIRAQAHVSGGVVKFFSRTRDEITESFPELPDALAGLPQDAILDGEIVAWEYPQDLARTQKVVDDPHLKTGEMKAMELGRARPFSVCSSVLGERK